LSKEDALRFMLLLYGDHEVEAALPREDLRAIVSEHLTFTARLREEGAYVYGDALDGPAAARVVRRDGTVTDGPFTESREQLGGLYVVECTDLEGALEYAKQVPKGPGLSVEVRPIPDL
jgi:hypothetical protein